MKIENVEKKNVLCLDYHGMRTNFCNGLNNNDNYYFIYKSGLNNLSLESYDVYIISMRVFYYKKAIEILDKIYAFNKPVIIIYSNELTNDNEGIKYLENHFEIKFENRDAAIIEDTYKGYLPQRNQFCALSMVSDKGEGKTYIKNTNNCFILRFENITIMHDNEIINKVDCYSDKTSILNELLNSPKGEQKPEWIDSIKVLDEAKIENNITEIEIEINDLQCEKTRLLKDLDSLVEYKKLLYATGNELVKIVKKVLTEMLDVKIQEVDVKKEDLSFELDEKKVLVEVKGVNTSIKREYVSQIQNHIFDDANKKQIEDEDISKRYKGLLIVNPYIKEAIQERKTKEFYSKTVINDLKHYDICAIDTITLLGLFNKFKTAGNVDLKDIILNSNYIKPEFSILDSK